MRVSYSLDNYPSIAPRWTTFRVTVISDVVKVKPILTNAKQVFAGQQVEITAGKTFIAPLHIYDADSADEDVTSNLQLLPQSIYFKWYNTTLRNTYF